MINTSGRISASARHVHGKVIQAAVKFVTILSIVGFDTQFPFERCYYKYLQVISLECITL